MNFFDSAFGEKICSLEIARDDRIIKLKCSQSEILFTIRGKFTNVFYVDDDNQSFTFKLVDEQSITSIKKELTNKTFLDGWNQVTLLPFDQENYLDEIRKKYPILGSEVTKEVKARLKNDSTDNIPNLLAEVLNEIRHSKSCDFIDEQEQEIHLGFENFKSFPFTDRKVLDSLIEAVNYLLSKKYYLEDKYSKEKLVRNHLERELKKVTSKIQSLGAVLRIEENTAMKRCAECHKSPQHSSSNLNDHTSKVACEACHIPAFARIQSTDLYRDFRETEVYLLKNLYEPKLTRQANVTPAYTFWNGGITFYDYASPANTGTLLAAPQGGINDAGSKLSPFELHHAMQAPDPVTGILLANKAGILFQTGDIDRAIRQAATELAISLPQGYDFVETGRYMGIFHEVAPANDALDCDDCHHPSASRIYFTALGYTPTTVALPRSVVWPDGSTR